MPQLLQPLYQRKPRGSPIKRNIRDKNKVGRPWVDSGNSFDSQRGYLILIQSRLKQYRVSDGEGVTIFITD